MEALATENFPLYLDREESQRKEGGLAVTRNLPLRGVDSL